MLLVHLSRLIRCAGLHLRLIALSTKLLCLNHIIGHRNLWLPIHPSMLLTALACRARRSSAHHLPIVHLTHLLRVLAMISILGIDYFASHILVVALIQLHALITAALRIIQDLVQQHLQSSWIILEHALIAALVLARVSTAIHLLLLLQVCLEKRQLVVVLLHEHLLLLRC